jgi:hypothetical protein
LSAQGHLLLAAIAAFPLAAGCVDVIERRTTTIVERKPLEPYVRRIPAEDRLVVEPTWESGDLVLRAAREQVRVEYGAERQVVRETTIREPTTWLPIILNGSIAAGALTAIIVAQLSKPDCRGGPFDEGCGMGPAVVQLAGVATVIPLTGLLLGDIYSVADTHKTRVWDVPTGALERRSALRPVAGEPITLRFEDGEQLNATTDANGMARLSVPPAKARSGGRAVLLLGGVQVRKVELGEPSSAP